jgi:hypothetical protein
VRLLAKVVAVMQPYFLPYAGYFRLFAAADEVILLDDVQFPRRGYVHRNRLRLSDGRLDWLTLPLARQAVAVQIRDLAFSAQAEAALRARLARFPMFAAPDGAAAHLCARIGDIGETSVTDYIVGLIAACCEILDLPFTQLRASRLDPEPGLTGQARIVQIARKCGAGIYLNPPGGRALYDPAAFARAGLELRFLAPWTGASESIAQRLHDEGAAAIRTEIRAAAQMER